MSTTTKFDGTATVNAVLMQLPESVEVFNAFGVDACCGGAASLDAAARDANAELVALLAALNEVARHVAADARLAVSR